jgi:hypothetical protein
VKLSQEKKDYIVRTAIEQLLKKRETRISAEDNEIAKFLYESCYPPEIQAHMNHLPDEFFVSQSHIYALYLGCKQQFHLKSSRKVSAKDNHDYRTPAYKVQPGSALSLRIEKHLASKDKLHNDRKALREKLTGMLAQITTDKRLQTEWPEGLRYYKAILDQPLPNLPAIQTADVNDFISQLEAADD